MTCAVLLRRDIPTRTHMDELSGDVMKVKM